MSLERLEALRHEWKNACDPACGIYHLWLARIKAALDPHAASDPFFYADPPGKADERVDL